MEHLFLMIRCSILLIWIRSPEGLAVMGSLASLLMWSEVLFDLEYWCLKTEYLRLTTN